VNTRKKVKRHPGKAGLYLLALGKKVTADKAEYLATFKKFAARCGLRSKPEDGYTFHKCNHRKAYIKFCHLPLCPIVAAGVRDSKGDKNGE